MTTFKLEPPIFDTITNTYNSYITKDNHRFTVQTCNFRLLNHDSKLRVEFLDDGNDFYQELNMIYAAIKDEMIENANDFFGFSINNKTMESLFHPIMMLPTKIPGFPIMEFEIGKCTVYDENGKKSTISILKPGMEIAMMLHISHVQFHPDRCFLIIYVETIGVVNGLLSEEEYSE